jgi:hypothetical protein
LNSFVPSWKAMEMSLRSAAVKMQVSAYNLFFLWIMKLYHDILPQSIQFFAPNSSWNRSYITYFSVNEKTAYKTLGYFYFALTSKVYWIVLVFFFRIFLYYNFNSEPINSNQLKHLDICYTQLSVKYGTVNVHKTIIFLSNITCGVYDMAKLRIYPL